MIIVIISIVNNIITIVVIFVVVVFMIVVVVVVVAIVITLRPVSSVGRVPDYHAGGLGSGIIFTIKAIKLVNKFLAAGTCRASENGEITNCNCHQCFDHGDITYNQHAFLVGTALTAKFLKPDPSTSWA